LPKGEELKIRPTSMYQSASLNLINHPSLSPPHPQNPSNPDLIPALVWECDLQTFDVGLFIWL